MGLLKDVQAPNEHLPDNVPDDFDYPEAYLDQLRRDNLRMAREAENAISASYQLAQQVILEISERNSAKPRRGPKPCLASYKEYKREFLSRWAKRISSNAKAIGWARPKLAKKLGFGGDDADANRQFRMVAAGATGTGGGHYRCKLEDFNDLWLPVAEKNNLYRRGCLEFLPTNLMSPEEFEEWAKDVTQMSFSEFREREKERDRMAYEHAT